MGVQIFASNCLIRRWVVGLRSREILQWWWILCGTAKSTCPQQEWRLDSPSSGWFIGEGYKLALTYIHPQQKKAASPKFMPLPGTSQHSVTGWCKGTKAWGPVQRLSHLWSPLWGMLKPWLYLHLSPDPPPTQPCCLHLPFREHSSIDFLLPLHLPDTCDKGQGMEYVLLFKILCKA